MSSPPSLGTRTHHFCCAVAVSLGSSVAFDQIQFEAEVRLRHGATSVHPNVFRDQDIEAQSTLHSSIPRHSALATVAN